MKILKERLHEKQSNDNFEVLEEAGGKIAKNQINEKKQKNVSDSQLEWISFREKDGVMIIGLIPDTIPVIRRVLS